LLTQVFDIIRKHHFFVKLSKCSFAQQEIEYLGHCISANGVTTEPSKIQVINEWPVPKNLKELRGFLGLTGYYRKFIRHYAVLCRPLTQLLKNNVPFVWNAYAQEAFSVLKQALVQAPVLAILDFNKTFVLETDACDTGFGAVLMQQGHPVAYLSKPVCDKNKGLSTYEKECMAIILAVEKWRSYLHHQEFIIKTDHRSLLFLTEQRVQTKLQHKALLKLMDLKFRIEYKQGAANVAADALSRCVPDQYIAAVSVSKPAWIINLVEGYKDDPKAVKLLEQLALTQSNDQGYSLHDGVIRYQGRIWLGNNAIAQQHVVQSLHSSGIGGHSGFHATYHRIKNLFAWPKMKNTIHQYIRECTVCHVTEPTKL
jgi:hypothetical protein